MAEFSAALWRIESGIWFLMKRFGAGFGVVESGLCSEMAVANGGGCDGGGF